MSVIDSSPTRYGYMGDQLYLMDCGEHLGWGYVDHPPFIALVAWVTRHLFGTSLFCRPPISSAGWIRARVACRPDRAEAGAIDLMGPKYGLPKAICPHMTYWLWGPRNYTGQTVIVVGSTPEGARRSFKEVAVIAELHNPYAPPWENKPVPLCRGPKNFRSLAEVWPRIKNRN